MSDINNTTLTGRLVRDPIVRYAGNGTAVGFFTLASNQCYKSKQGEMQKETAFVSCKAFGGWAEALARHKKGEMLIASGRLKTEQWEKEGATRSELVLVCSALHFVASSASDRTQEEPADDAPAGAAAVANGNGPPF
jgi:single-strand DNA-binding protein